MENPAIFADDECSPLLGMAAFADDECSPLLGMAAIPLAELAPWAVFGTVIALILLYFVSTEQGAMALFDGMYIHEYVHDGRHLLGFPCH